MNLEDLLFPEIQETPEDIIKKYPKRENVDFVTRIAPSPTGFLHIGTVYSAMIDKIFTYKNKGIFYFRVEDTDQKREVEGAAKKYVQILKEFGLNFSEGPIGELGEDIGNYGPYTQSQREYIYKVFIKDLIKKGLAYPCFLTEEEITETRRLQELKKRPTGIYKEYSPYRYAKQEEIEKKLKDKKEFVIRIKSSGELTKKIEVNDLVKGKILMQENFLDIVICKKTGIPTYHFAHLIDDHLMGTTHVIRGDEWFASLPLHLELFKIIGWNAPKYAHYGPLVKVDDGAKRKLSKRKDLEADVDFYFKEGFLIDAIKDFLSNIINSGFEEWRINNINSSYLDFDFKFEKINSSGALVDINKLKWVNSNYIKNLDIQKLYFYISNYLEKYEHDFFINSFSKAKKEFTISIIEELRTRLVIFSEFKKLTGFFYTEGVITEETEKLLLNQKMKIFDIDIVKKALNIALEVLNNSSLDVKDSLLLKNLFIEKIAESGLKNGQVLWPIRVSLSLEEFSPGAFELISIFGKEKSIEKIQKILDYLK